MARIITVCNQKGGVGKTTTVINLSACLAELGRKVLAVDLDPQANCTSGLGVQPNDITHSIYEVLAQPKKFIIYQLEDVVIHTKWPGLDLVPSHINLAGAELELVNKLGREVLLKKALRPIAGLYDYILMDTPPSLSLLTVNALTAVDEVLISMRAEPWSLDGIENLLETIEIVKEDLNPGIKLAGVLVTMVEPRTQLAREILNRLEGDGRLREHMLATRIRRNVKLSECADAGEPIIHYDDTCHGAWAYRRAARELLVLGGEAKLEDFPELLEEESEEQVDELEELEEIELAAESRPEPIPVNADLETEDSVLETAPLLGVESEAPAGGEVEPPEYPGYSPDPAPIGAETCRESPDHCSGEEGPFSEWDREE